MQKSVRLLALALLSIALMAQSGCGGGSSSSVTAAQFTITVNPTSASVVVGGIRTFTAQARNSAGDVLSGVAFSWRSSNTTIAMSVGGGGFRGIAVGSVSITASASFVVKAGQGLTNVVSPAATLSVDAAVEGTAAQGVPLADASVSLRDATGQYAAGSADISGHFHIPVAGMTAPFLLKVVSPDGHVLYGMAADIGIANLDPYTDLMVRDWYVSHGSDADRAFVGEAGVPSVAGMQALDRLFTTLLHDALSAEGLDAVHYSLLSTPFDADHAGFDQLLDETRIDLGAGRIQVAGTSLRLEPADGVIGWQQILDTGTRSGSLQIP